MRRRAAIAGFAEWPAVRHWERPMFTLEAYQHLAREALAEVGIEPGEVDGIISTAVPESPLFGPAGVAEYLGFETNFGEIVDLGGATGAGMIWRAVAAIEAGACDTVLCLASTIPAPRNPAASVAPGRWFLGADAWGAAHGQFDLPYGLVNPNAHFALIAQRYMHEYGVRPETLAKVAVQARYNALANPAATMFNSPITVEDVLASPMVMDPLHLLEIVMPCSGGVCVVITTEDRARRANHRPVMLTGFAEHIIHKSITYAKSMTDTPLRGAADRAFSMAGLEREDIDLASLYDCYTITVLLEIEDSGFCKKGEGKNFIDDHDLRFDGGDWPLNTHGGQLGMGQAGIAGGMAHVTEAIFQLQGRAGPRQLSRAERAYVTGTGGFMAEQVALILEGA